MKHFLNAVVTGLVMTSLTACAYAQPASQSLDQSSVKDAPSRAELQALVNDYAEKRGFSGTVLVARGGEILLEASYGKANIEWDIPNSSSTRYSIGSLSKPFGATLIMSLVEDDILALDGTLGEYLPDLYAGTPLAPVTIAQLLSHKSGITDIPRDLNGTWWQTIARQTFEPEAFAEAWIKPVLTAEPGTQWQYINAGFILLGVVVERVTGQSYAANLETRVFAPAGMSSSGVSTSTAIVNELAHGYSKTPRRDLAKASPVDPSVLFSAGSLYATAQDIYSFDRALYGDALVSADARKSMMSAKNDSPSGFGYGYGWAVETWSLADETPLSIVHHTGSIPGFQSYYIRSETNEDCVIVIDNNNQGSIVSTMAPELMRALNGDPVLPVQRDAEDLLSPIAYDEGASAMLAAYEALGERTSEYNFDEGPLNRLGYKFLGLGLIDEAIALFELSVQLFPASANTHDSLGEAYRKAGRIEEAVASYKEALKVDPKFPSALAALDEMQTTN